MADIRTRTKVVTGIAPDKIPFDDMMAAQEPVIFRGLAREQPLVQAGLSSPETAMAYLKSFYGGTKVVGYTAAPELQGRFFYNDDMTGLNFKADRVMLDEFLDLIAAHLTDPNPPAFYIGSTDLDIYLPGLRAANSVTLNHEMFEANPPLVSIWIGNRTTATAHFDMSHNIAWCVAGRRRFTLFPPDQIGNLYPGPLEPTPGGQVVSLVDFRKPDYGRFPKFRDAEATGQVADLEPGDVLFYPALWWHHVEALEPFNILINYWWNTSPSFMDTPMNTLLHGILSLRDRPDHEKTSWRALFDYYVFGDGAHAAAHIPEGAQGNLGPLDAAKARRLRAMLLNRINR